MDLMAETSDSSDNEQQDEIKKSKKKKKNQNSKQKKKNEIEVRDEERSCDEDESEDVDVEDLDIDLDEDVSDINFGANLYKPTDEEKQLLKNLNILLKHTPPPQHEIERTAGTRTLKGADKEKFEKYITLRTGTFSPDEDSILKHNWRKFCIVHSWNNKNPKPFLYMKHGDKEFFLMNRKNRIKFVQFLANGLNDRSLYSVYHRFRILYEPHKTCRYTPEEDNIISNYIKKYDMSGYQDRKFADLASILKRTRASVWRRYRKLKENRGKKIKATKK